MTLHHTRSISGSGSQFPFEALAALVRDVDESLEGSESMHENVKVDVKQWRASGDGYGEVEAGFRIEVTW